MADQEPQPGLVRFGSFEANLRAGELRREGVKLKFGGQPFQVLAFLVGHAGEVVTREELQKHLWPDTFVDVDHNLNTAINKIREALGDSAEDPRFVETLPKRGYRFIAPVTGRFPSSDTRAEESPAAISGTNRKRPYYKIALLGVVLVMAGSFVFWKTAMRPQATPRVLRFRKLTNDGHGKLGPMSTDGSRIYFGERVPGSGPLIFQVPVNGGESTPLSVPLKQPSLLDISRDGTELLVKSGESDRGDPIWIQPVSGGSPRRVGTVIGYDAAFGADGTGILYATGHDIYSVRRDGLVNRKLLTTESLPFGFRFSPDGRAFRFTEADYLTDSVKIMEASSEGIGSHKVLDGCCGVWTRDGRFFIFQDRADDRLNFWATEAANHFHWSKRADKPTQLTSGPMDYQYPLPSKDGKEIFAFGSAPRTEVARYDPRSGEFIPFLAGISAKDVAFSPDGQWVAYSSYPEGMLWRSKVDGSDRLQLTFPPLGASLPRWSPDGKQIAFAAGQPGETTNIYLIPSEGGTPQRILPSAESQMDPNWSPDGNSLVFATLAVPKMPIFLIDLKTRKVTILPGSSGLFSPHWSPDGRFMAAITTQDSTLMLFNFATQKWTQVYGSMMAYESWSHDGKYIYFETLLPGGNCPIFRFRMSDRKTETAADSGKLWRLAGPSEGCGWIGLAPDDSPMVSRDISTQEIYALEMEWP
jgi:Tol biopolymer transport system component/DNA-binding winged helix-turn-helix (wHTH) protein